MGLKEQLQKHLEIMHAPPTLVDWNYIADNYGPFSSPGNEQFQENSILSWNMAGGYSKHAYDGLTSADRLRGSINCFHHNIIMLQECGKSLDKFFFQCAKLTYDGSSHDGIATGFGISYLGICHFGGNDVYFAHIWRNPKAREPWNTMACLVKLSLYSGCVPPVSLSNPPIVFGFGISRPFVGLPVPSNNTMFTGVKEIDDKLHSMCYSVHMQCKKSPNRAKIMLEKLPSRNVLSNVWLAIGDFNCKPEKLHRKIGGQPLRIITPPNPTRPKSNRKIDYCVTSCSVPLEAVTGKNDRFSDHLPVNYIFPHQINN